MHSINLFISHSWSYSGHYEKLKEWIFDEAWNHSGTPIKFGNLSVPKDDPIHNAPNTRILDQKINSLIGRCNVVVIPTGMYATHSYWIKREIIAAQNNQVPILAVNPWGQQQKSAVVRSNAKEEVGWTSESVVNGIWRLYLDV